MKPGCLWIGVSRLNSLMSNEVQALIKVFPHHRGIHNNTLIWGSSKALVKDEFTPLPLLPQQLSLGGFPPPHQAAYTKPTTFGRNLVEKTQKYHRLMQSPRGAASPEIQLQRACQRLSKLRCCMQDGHLSHSHEKETQMLQAAGQSPSPNQKPASRHHGYSLCISPPSFLGAMGNRKAVEYDTENNLRCVGGEEISYAGKEMVFGPRGGR